jgi:hypothetical protein
MLLIILIENRADGKLGAFGEAEREPEGQRMIFTKTVVALRGIKKGLKIGIHKKLATAEWLSGVDSHETATAMNGSLAVARQAKCERQTKYCQESRYALHDAVHDVKCNDAIVYTAKVYRQAGAFAKNFSRNIISEEQIRQF